jgi:hypothetical protein
MGQQHLPIAEVELDMLGDHPVRHYGTNQLRFPRHRLCAVPGQCLGVLRCTTPG